MATVKQKIDIANLELGMYVSQLDRDWLDSPFLLQGFLVDSEETLQQLKSLCDFVYIDTVQGKSPNSKEPLTIKKETTDKSGLTRSTVSTTSGPRVTFEEEIKQAKKVHKQLRTVVNSLFESAISGGRLDINQAKEVVSEVVNSISRNQHALEWMTQLKNKDEYTAIHSMNVCILSVKLAKHVGFNHDDLNLIGLCGMLHDIGKLKVPNEILNKPGALTEEEMEIMQHHADMGANLLQQDKDVPDEVYVTTLSHHEKLDGTGYPNGVAADQVDTFTRIVSIADIYDAVTSDRIYHKGMSPNDAASLLYKLRGHHLDNELVESFIQCVGVYPVGSLVEIKTGEVGMVVSTSDRHRLNPNVLMVLDREKNRLIKPHIVNTANIKDDMGKLKYEISRSLDTYSYDISPREFFD